MDDVIPDPTTNPYSEKTKRAEEDSSRLDPTQSPIKKGSKKPKSNLKRRPKPAGRNLPKKENLTEFISPDINIQVHDKEEELTVTGETPVSNKLIAISHPRDDIESPVVDFTTGGILTA